MKTPMMTDDEIQCAITAEASKHCKCKDVGNEKACNWNCPCGNSVMSGVCKNCCRDYLNDLNAMAEAEKVLTGGFKEGDQWLAYVKLLHKENCGQGERATAKQRAEAFCRTLFPERFKE